MKLEQFHVVISSYRQENQVSELDLAPKEWGKRKQDEI